MYKSVETSNRRILKTLRGSPKVKVQRGQYLLAVGLNYYKWYQSHVSMMLDTQSHIGGCWALKGVSKQCAGKNVGS